MDDEPLADSVELEPDLMPGMEPEEGEPVRRTIKRMPSEQGSNIPLGWKPTPAKPIPVTRCVYVWPDGHDRQGERCNRWSLRGTQRCYIHGGRGNLKNIETYRQAIIEAARLEMTEYAPAAVTGLWALAENASAENVRLKAYTEVLDRIGLKAAEQFQVDVTHHDADPAVALAQRLAKLKKAADEIRQRDDERRTAANADILHSLDGSVVLELEAGGEIIDGEIVD